MKYKVGDIFFIRGKGIYSKLILVYNYFNFKENKATHCGIITRIEGNKLLIHEALSNGFVYEWYDLKDLESDRISVGRIKRYKLKDVLDNANKYHGRPYAFYDIFKIVLFYLTGFRGFYFTGANKLICSEAVSRVLYDSSNKKIKLGYDPRKTKMQKSEYKISFDLISPMHVYNSRFVKILE